MIDVAVVGGGPVGLATAIAARRHGLAVTVLEAGSATPRDKACGEGLMPSGARALRTLGVDPAALGAAFTGIRFVSTEHLADGLFTDGPGYGVRRLDLHAALVERARAAGAELRFGVRATGLGGGGVVTDQGPVAARFVVGADGLRSAVRTWSGLGAVRRERRGARFGVRRHVAVAPWSDRVEVHWADDPRRAAAASVEAYVTPVGPPGDRYVGVALLWRALPGAAVGLSPASRPRFDQLLACFPTLAERLAAGAPRSTDRGAGPFLQPVGRVAKGRVALVGDAAGYVDAITGEGLGLGFAGAELLAAALASGDLAGYARAHRRLVRIPFLATHGLLLAERHAWLRRRLLATFARDPAVFASMLAVLDRDRAPGVALLLRLAAGLLRRPRLVPASPPSCPTDCRTHPKEAPR